MCSVYYILLIKLNEILSYLLFLPILVVEVLRSLSARTQWELRIDGVNGHAVGKMIQKTWKQSGEMMHLIGKANKWGYMQRLLVCISLVFIGLLSGCSSQSRGSKSMNWFFDYQLIA